MSRFRMYPSRAQAERMLTHCALARYVWNLAVGGTTRGWARGTRMCSSRR
ncbi:helix-turn-helix domain-containing protein [Streptomyces scabiei]